MTQSVMRPGLFLDRDGVINEDTGFVYRSEDFRFIDGIIELVSTLKARGFAVVVATNQSGIGRGLFSEAGFQALTDWMREEFRAQGAEIDAVYHCPDHPTEGIGAYRRDSFWRKPKPGMLLQAAKDLNLDLARSCIVGDKDRDVEAGRAAGVGLLVLFDPHARELHSKGDVVVAPRLRDVIDLLANES